MNISTIRSVHVLLGSHGFFMGVLLSSLIFLLSMPAFADDPDDLCPDPIATDLVPKPGDGVSDRGVSSAKSRARENARDKITEEDYPTPANCRSDVVACEDHGVSHWNPHSEDQDGAGSSQRRWKPGAQRDAHQFCRSSHGRRRYRTYSACMSALSQDSRYSEVVYRGEFFFGLWATRICKVPEGYIAQPNPPVTTPDKIPTADVLPSGNDQTGDGGTPVSTGDGKGIGLSEGDEFQNGGEPVQTNEGGSSMGSQLISNSI